MSKRLESRLRLRISAAAETALRNGHPWLFAESIRAQNHEGKTGELAVIYDRNNKFLALGLFDPESPIRFRVLHVGKPQNIDRDWWLSRLEAAIARRAGLFDSETTGHRWINGESDGWPGLVLDRYDCTLVIKLYTVAWLPWLEAIVPIFQQRLAPQRIVLRLSRNIQTIADGEYGRRDGEALWGKPVESIVLFQESGLRFEADVIRGQKTGFFLDQRENRRRAAALAAGRTVLNAFSFSGGFSVYCARDGAKSVLDLDISAHALQAAKRNFELNRDNLEKKCGYDQAQADAFEWLRGNRKFGLIILDPPSLAKRESERAGAIRAYHELAKMGLSNLEPGGILIACSCSAHVTAEEFFATVRKAAAKASRDFEEIETTHHPADHPVAFKEAEYLKAIYLQVR
jgi:23S rRNA (cytosine1962-C5)-methyltransferase